MKVKEIMHKSTFVGPDTTICQAARVMEKRNISSIIVGTPEEAIGMFTERDMLREVIIKNLDSKKTSMYELMCETELDSVMCKVMTTVNHDAPIEDAVDLMMGRYIRHMPVSDDTGKIIGMVSARKIMNALRILSLQRLAAK